MIGTDIPYEIECVLAEIGQHDRETVEWTANWLQRRKREIENEAEEKKRVIDIVLAKLFARLDEIDDQFAMRRLMKAARRTEEGTL